MTEALYKKALGYSIEEIVEEYTKDKETEELLLNKRKVTKKLVPPDISAVKTLLELMARREVDFKNFTDEELQQEKMKLLKLLAKEEKK